MPGYSWFGMSILTDYNRAGTYVASASDFPVVLGSELSGTVVALPTDTTVLANADYQKRGYQIDGKVVGVSCIVMVSRAPY